VSTDPILLMESPPPRIPDPDIQRTPTDGYWYPAVLISILVVGVVAVVSLLGNWHWASDLWFNYSWSSDKGNGPEAIQQTIVYAAAAALLVPLVRKFIAREFAKVHHSIHIHGTEITAHLHHVTEKMGLPRFEHSDAYKAHIAEHKAPK
jgi:hypothetical protein